MQPQKKGEQNLVHILNVANTATGSAPALYLNKKKKKNISLLVLKYISTKLTNSTKLIYALAGLCKLGYLIVTATSEKN